jgi:CIC family chloride channel protein
MTPRDPIGALVRRLLPRFRTSVSQFLHHDNVILMVLAVALGVIGGYSALAFRRAAALVLNLCFDSTPATLVQHAVDLPWWQIVLAPTLGGVIVGQINQRFLDGRAPQGVTHIITCSMLHGAQIPLRGGLASAVSSALSIGVGASVGREGSLVHFTATLSSWLARRLKLPAHHAHTVLGCALAAAMAAAFNAPIAGVFFSLEVVLGHYELSAFAPVVVSSVIGTIITRLTYGDFPAYVLPHYDFVTYWEFPAMLILGVVAGLVAITFMASVFFCEDNFARFKVPGWARPPIAGLFVGLVAIRFPQVLSVGYEVTNAALNQSLGLTLLLLLALLKLLTSGICCGGGFGGGVFSPAIFLGATVGAAFGIIAGHVGGVPVHPGLYAIVGMAATSSAVLGAPISTILVIFELLGDFKVTVSVMSGAVVACVIVQQIYGDSFHSRQLRRLGIVIEGARALQILRERTVAEVMTAPRQLVPATLHFGELKRLLQCLPESAEAIVVDENNGLVGTISMDDIKDVAFDPLVNEDALEAQHLTRLYPATLPIATTLEQALKVMEQWKADRLPVVKDAASQEIAGMLDHKTLLTAYNQALLQAESEAHGGGHKAAADSGPRL